jgi:Flp pilus assembly pilin Flp
MLQLVVRVLQNEEGYTSVEYGILTCLMIIFAEKLAS